MKVNINVNTTKLSGNVEYELTEKLESLASKVAYENNWYGKNINLEVIVDECEVEDDDAPYGLIKLRGYLDDYYYDEVYEVLGDYEVDVYDAVLEYELKKEEVILEMMDKLMVG